MREDKDEEEEAVCETAYNVAIYGNCLSRRRFYAAERTTPSIFMTVRTRESRLLFFL